MRLPRFAIDLADDIAALVVREFEFGVLAQEDVGAAPLVAAIAAARYRGCDEFGTDHPVLGYQIAAEILRSEEHTSELQSLMRISYDVFCLKNIKDNDRSISTN